MKTKEEILKENGVLDKSKSPDEMFALSLTRDGYRHTVKMILLSMEEHGKQMYNQAIDDCLANAEVREDYVDTGIGGYTEPVLVYDSLTKLKKK